MTDVLIVGGGPAGLSAAAVLARFRLHVTLVDAGEPRNASASHAHGFLTRDGMSPAELRDVGRDEASRYGVELVDATVESAERDDDGFAVTLDDGRTLRAPRMLVATGLRDVLPEVDGLAERWGRDVVHCPFCHGYEVRDTVTVVHARHPHAVQTSWLVSSLTDRLTLVDDDGDLDPADLDALRERGVEVVSGTVVGVSVEDDRLRGVRLEDGREIPCETFYSPGAMVPNDELLEALGAESDEGEFGPVVRVDEEGRTSVPHLWGAGNAVDQSAQIVHAASDGYRAAMSIAFDALVPDRAGVPA